MSGILIEGKKRFRMALMFMTLLISIWFWIGAALLSVLFALLVWNAKSKEVD